MAMLKHSQRTIKCKRCGHRNFYWYHDTNRDGRRDCTEHLGQSSWVLVVADTEWLQHRRVGRSGWAEGVEEAMPLADEAIEQVEAEIETLEFESVWDVTGSEVDVGRYVEGVPENMVEYTTVPVSTVGKVVTLCASTCYSGSLSAKSVLRRGAAIVGLALALDKSGHAVELWADMSCRELRGDGRCGTRVLVKGAHDTLDASKVAYAYAHPTMLRRLFFADMAGAPADMKQRHGMPGRYGKPSPPIEDLPEGTIYLPALKTGHDIEEPERFILDTLDELGLRVS